LLALGIVVLVIVVLVGWYEIEAHPFGGEGKAVVVFVKHDASTDSVLSSLQSKGVISSSLAFRLGDLIHGTPDVQEGGYQFHQNSSFGTVRSVLAAGPNVFGVDVLAGFTLQEVASAVGDVPGHTSTHFLATARSGAVHSPYEPSGVDNLEGLLGAGTYLVTPGETDTQLLGDMTTRFAKDAQLAGLSSTTDTLEGASPYSAVTAASIVQKEGYIVKNMGPVARVIDNRLAHDMPLQMDATILYSLGQDGGPVTPADLALNTPYNTYLHTGLTPTPICVPSIDALKAVVDPPVGNWLYFVVVQHDGTEAFADTFAEQLANEKLAQSRGVG
jgi:UPF0755 protein